MEVKINKEIRNYTESIFFGLSLRQCFFSVIAILVAVGIYFLCNEKMGLEVTTWLCMFGAFPFAALGFITYQGMTAEKIIKTAWRSFLLSRKQLHFKPVNLYFDTMKNWLETKKKEDLIPDDKKLRKTKKTRKR
ncbi:MAG: PrgI family protein [Erysipelotrichaceae bacterium]